MKKYLKPILAMASVLLFSAAVMAKLPAPSDEAKSKTAEAAARTTWAGKVEGFQLCKAQDRVAAHFYKTAKATGKEARPAFATAPCADPGPFAYAPATAPASPAAAPASAALSVKKS